MFETSWKFNFFHFFEELLDVAMWLPLPMGCTVGCQEMSLFYLKNFYFYVFEFCFFHMVLCGVIFNVTNVRLGIEVFGFFQETLQVL
jgi:hypothetical protein